MANLPTRRTPSLGPMQFLGDNHRGTVHKTGGHYHVGNVKAPGFLGPPIKLPPAITNLKRFVPNPGFRK